MGDKRLKGKPDIVISKAKTIIDLLTAGCKTGKICRVPHRLELPPQIGVNVSESGNIIKPRSGRESPL